ncbi:cobalamin biosynthesis protein CobD [Iodidimonas nitroreducens]|uniref:Cobalamin biosynthesis protein CobD n=1 Tax=Iodidimonas nitroreducens TaxID=1236968 RepID=A0A5A7NCB9_9PROT|nr:cobalamin biosynthesis protein [Iodidimonas nitroreducens]GAK33380.1 cobalamin biosynthesis protein CobD [alpha proteobacterium Q-1]GER04616.1 cobalamin biosynthesis protein CobD [Iodidimonas nitroreducens]
MTGGDLPFASLSGAMVIVLALVFNLIFCSSSRISRVFSFPMTWASGLIAKMESRYNQPSHDDRMRRADSLSVAVFLLIFGLLCGFLLSIALAQFPYAWIIKAMFLASLINLRPMLERLRLMANSLALGLEEGRAMLTLLTGRDTSRMNESALSAAAIESGAMGFVQGHIAPILWFVLGGFPALIAYKLLDTASIMIDEQSDHARSFGTYPRAFSAAFLLPATVLSAPFLLLGSLVLWPGRTIQALRILCRNHRYAWPVFSPAIAVFSGSLGVRLGGPVCIGSHQRKGDFFGGQLAEPGIRDITISRTLYAISCAILVLMLFILEYAASFISL